MIERIEKSYTFQVRNKSISEAILCAAEDINEGYKLLGFEPTPEYCCTDIYKPPRYTLTLYKEVSST